MSEEHEEFLAHFKEFFYVCPDLLCIASKEGYFKVLNDSWTKLLGYSNKELTERPFVDFVHPDDVNKTLDETRSLGSDLHRTIYFENRYRKADASYIWLAWGASSRGNEIYAIAKDVTLVKETERFLRDIQTQAKIGGWTLYLSDHRVDLTEEAYRIHEIPSDSPFDLNKGLGFYHEDYRSVIAQLIDRCISHREPYEGEFKIITPNGQEKWVKATGNAVVNHKNEVEKLIGTFQDINDVKSLENKLRDTAEQLSNLLQNSPGMVYELKLEPSKKVYFTFTSHRAFEIFEMDRKVFEDDSAVFVSMIHPDDLDDFHSALANSARQLVQLSWDGRIITHTGKVRWIKAKGNPKAEKSGAILWSGIIVDVTKEMELQAELDTQRAIAYHSSKLAAIGELSAGIGHEVNNPLAIIQGLLSQMRRRLASGKLNTEDLQDLLAKQAEACDRIKKIVDGLRVFARKDNEPGDAVSDLKQAVESAVDFVAEIYRQAGISISSRVPEGECPSICDAGQVQQVLLNLFSNARDALQKKSNGKILVELTEQDYFWQISVSDNGSGIPEKIRNRIYESFFTTKPSGQGTGIGLAVCKSIMDACGGRISFETVDNKGTNFILNFPRANLSSKNTGVEPAFQHQFSKLRPLKTMIVEDEDVIREILFDCLTELGCEVALFSEASQALKNLKSENYDLLFTDIKMPVMDGLSFLRHIAEQELAPDTFKVVISGSTFGTLSSVIEEASGPIFDGFVAKPFSDTDLSNIIRQAQNRRIKGLMME